MRRDKLIKAVLVAALVVFSASSAYAEEFFARLNGFQEIGALAGPTGAIRSNGSSTLHLNLDKDATTATFTLTFSDVGTTLPLTGTVTQAHHCRPERQGRRLRRARRRPGIEYRLRQYPHDGPHSG